MQDMIELNLLAHTAKLRHEHQNGQSHLWDQIRRKWVRSSPEELVRQLLIVHFIEDMGYSPRLMQVEKKLLVNGMNRRFDMLVYQSNMQPFLLVECKSASYDLTQAAFDQIARYNLTLQVPYLLVTNGRQHFCCQMDYENETYTYVPKIPGPPSSILEQ